MCKDQWCPAKEQCYRYVAPVNEYRQSYFMLSPRVDGKCEMYVPCNYDGGEKNVTILGRTVATLCGKMDG
jgi:hypothetical protein